MTQNTKDAVPKDDQQQTFGPNSEPHGWAVMEVLTRDMYGALRSRTTIRAKDGFLDMAIEEYVGTQGRAKRTDVRLHGEALEVLRSILTRPVAAPVAPTAEQAEGVLVPIEDLRAIYAAMNHLGDVLNGMDSVEAEDEVATNPGFAAIRRALGEVAEDDAPAASTGEQA